MKTLSYHILDIVQNSLKAKADLVEISIFEDDHQALFTLAIVDDGQGMDQKTLQKSIDPCFTTRKERKVGLGLSLLKQNAERTGGSFWIDSQTGTGTCVKAAFVKSHIDCPAVGDLAGTIHQIMVSNFRKDFIYSHNINGLSYKLDTRQIKEVLDYLPIYHPELSMYIEEMIRENLNRLRNQSHEVTP
jgi:hypothetical protein